MSISEGPTSFKIYAADPKTGQVGFFGEIFKISKGQIHDIEANGFLLPYGANSDWKTL